jgi:hypothetical protein
MRKDYSSFAEIDQQLKLLALKRDIARERLILKRNKLQASLRPAHLGELFKNKVQKSLFFILASVLVRKLRSAKRDN